MLDRVTLNQDQIEKIETRESRTAEGIYTETHLTRWRGTLTGYQIAGIVQAYLAEQLSVRTYGLTSSLSSSFMPLEAEVAFELVLDHDWFVKETAAQAAQD